MIVFVVVDIEAGYDTQIWHKLMGNLKTKNEDIQPLIANKILEKGDISVVMRVSHPKMLSDYIISNIRSVEGVRDVETYYLLNAVFLGSKDKISRSGEGIQAYISIQTEPSKDKEVSGSIAALEEKYGVYSRFVGYTFHKPGFNILYSLNAPDLDSLEKFLYEKIRTIDDVSDTELMIGTNYEYLADPKAIYT